MVSDKWAAAKVVDTAKVDVGYAALTAVTDEILSLISLVGDSSNLILDPDIESFYIMDLILLKLPAQVDALGKAQVLAEAAAGRKAITPEDKTQLAILSGTLHANLDGIKDDVRPEKGFKDPGQKARLQSLYAANAEAVGAVVATLDEKFLRPAVPTAGPGELAAVGSLALAKASAFYDASAPTLGDWLNGRIDARRNRMYSALGISLLAILLCSYLCLGFYASVQQSLTALGQAMASMERLDLTVHAEVFGRDEFYDMAKTLDRSLTKLRETFMAIEGVAQRVASGSTELAATTEQMDAATREIAKAGEGIRGKTGRMPSARTECTASIEEVATNVHQTQERTRLAMHASDPSRDAGCSSSPEARRPLTRRVDGKTCIHPSQPEEKYRPAVRPPLTLARFRHRRQWH